MNGRDSFDKDDWQALCRLPLMVATTISAIDYSMVSEDREYRAFAAFIKEAAGKRKQAAVVVELLADTDYDDRETFLSLCQSVTGALSGDNPVERTFAAAKAAGKTVDKSLSKKDAKAYKTFILDVALAVARAHKESMLPLTGSVSRVEDFHIRRLADALGL